MDDRERRENQPEDGTIKVKLGEPFGISPNLDSIKKDSFGSLLIDSIALEIGGLGQGKIEILHDKTLDEIPPYIHIRTPAGPIELRYIMNDGQPESVFSSLPITPVVRIDNLEPKQLETTTCTLIFGDKEFEGDPAYDVGEPLFFYRWLDPITQELCELYFPMDPEIIKQIKFVIGEKREEENS